ncbi:hypothetical protein [Streptomyces anulatus]|uniref:hypothetical protein n=1 Tax=Streptomyces anulatus TaxID=1892 RepID=UPI00344A2F5A
MPNLVAWDRDYSDGKLVETELAFFAQDDDGNVWHFGQYPEVHENGRLVEAPAWLSPSRRRSPESTCGKIPNRERRVIAWGSRRR